MTSDFYDIFNFHSEFFIGNFKLSKIKIKNFKSIQNSEFDITQTVFLSGLNSSGKSTYTQAVLLILQWLSGASSGPKGYLPLNGELVSLGMVKDVYNRESLDRSSSNFLKPISIELEFSESDEENVGFKTLYSVNFELTPKFMQRKTYQVETFDVENKTEIEITKVTSKIIIDKNDEINKEAVTNHRIFALFEPQVEEGIDQDITIESVYQKTYSSITRNELAKKHFLGHILVRPLRPQHFYLYDLESSSVPEFTQLVKIGKKTVIKDSRLFPRDILIGTEVLPNGLKSQANDLLQIKTQSARTSNNPENLKLIEKFINEELPHKIFTEIQNVNSFPVLGRDLAKIRLFFDFIMFLKNGTFQKVERINTHIDTYQNGSTPSDGKGFKEYKKIIKSINNKSGLKNEDTFQSDSPYLDEVIGIYLNILEINVSSEQHREILENYRQSMNTENKIFQCLDNNHGFDMDMQSFFKKNYIKKK